MPNAAVAGEEDAVSAAGRTVVFTAVVARVPVLGLFPAVEFFFTAALPATGAAADLVPDAPAASPPPLLAERFDAEARAAERGATEAELAAD